MSRRAGVELSAFILFFIFFTMLSSSLEEFKRSQGAAEGRKKLLRSATIGPGTLRTGSFGYMNSMLHGKNLCIVMVGLPARGKSYLGTSWLVFNKGVAQFFSEFI